MPAPLPIRYLRRDVRVRYTVVSELHIGRRQADPIALVNLTIPLVMPVLAPKAFSKRL